MCKSSEWFKNNQITQAQKSYQVPQKRLFKHFPKFDATMITSTYSTARKSQSEKKHAAYILYIWYYRSIQDKKKTIYKSIFLLLSFKWIQLFPFMKQNTEVSKLNTFQKSYSKEPVRF